MIRSPLRGRRSSAVTSLTLGGVLAFIAACSSTAPAGPTISNDDACTDNAKAMCAKLNKCTPGALKGVYGEVATCQSRLKSRCLDGLAAPSTGATAEKAEACAQAYGDYDCTDYRNKTKIPSACQEPKGKLADGAACEYPGQCASTFCAISPGNGCGVCSAPPNEGEPCDKLTSCGQTLTCAASTLKCVTPGAQGAACGAGNPCGAGFSCTGATNGAGGTCQPSGAEAGAACDPNGTTAAPCDSVLNLYCDTVNHQCAQTTYGAAGQACGYDSTAGTLVDCSSGACIGADASAKKLGACKARGDDGGDCTLFTGGASTPDQGCIPPARCVVASGSTDGKCQVTKAATCH